MIVPLIIIKMIRFGNRQQPDIDFPTLLNQTTNGANLLKNPAFLEQVRWQSKIFTLKIIQPKYRQILHDLIDIAIYHEAYNQRDIEPITTILTHAAIETLCSLTQQFVECIFDGEGSQAVVGESSSEYPILRYIFRVLEQPIINQTGLAYFVRLVSPFLYQRPAQMIGVLLQVEGKLLIKHFYSKSICELFGKVMEMQSEGQFFGEQKVQLIQMVCAQVSTYDELALQASVESFAEFIELLVEKHNDKYQRSKYSTIITKVLETPNNFLFLIDRLQTYKHKSSIRVQLLRSLDAFLRIHLPPTIKKLGSQPLPIDTLPLSTRISQSLQKYLSACKPRQFMTDLRLELVNYYRLVKSIIAVQPSCIGTVLDRQFLLQTLDLMKQDTNNNILHNYQKDVVVSAISSSADVTTLLHAIGIEDILRNSLSDKLGKFCYQNQLFLIGEAITDRMRQSLNLQNWADILKLIETKRIFHSVKIDGKQKQLIIKPNNQKKTNKNPMMVHHEKGFFNFCENETNSEQDLLQSNDADIDEMLAMELQMDSDKQIKSQQQTNMKDDLFDSLPDMLPNSPRSKQPAVDEIERLLKSKYGVSFM